MFAKLLNRFKRSRRIHLRSKVKSLKDAIDLVDRFVDDKYMYPLEWDDFISWHHENPSIESMRDQMANLERKIVSRNPGDKQQAKDELVSLRNHYARLIGIPARGVD